MSSKHYMSFPPVSCIYVVLIISSVLMIILQSIKFLINDPRKLTKPEKIHSTKILISLEAIILSFLFACFHAILFSYNFANQLWTYASASNFLFLMNIWIVTSKHNLVFRCSKRKPLVKQLLEDHSIPIFNKLHLCSNKTLVCIY